MGRTVTSFATAALLLLACALPLHARAGAERDALDEVVVTSTLRGGEDLDVPISLAVLDRGTLAEAGQQQLQDVLGLIPNLNWAGDTARPRYFQIRGVGELEQYQGAPNPSVGFLIDDIDFSGLGGAATLYDIDRVEVLRGPQGTRYGANALGGLIYVRSREPTADFDAGADLSGGNYATQSYGAWLSGPVAALDSAFRLTAQRYTSDGFYRNVYLHRSDTDNRNELTLRGRWRYEPSPDLRIDLVVLHVQLDNGYDAYTIDNSRTTRSDQPSVDQQHSSGLALHADWSGLPGLALTGIGTWAKTRVKYGFDGDWGNPDLWAEPRFGGVIYRYSDLQYRDRDTGSLELRLATRGEHRLDWLIGVYLFQLRERLRDTSLGLYQTDPADPATASLTDTVIASRYTARNAAVFGELEGHLGERWSWSAGARGERRTTRYSDLTTALDTPPAANRFGPADDLWGGALSLTWKAAPTQSLYASLARGYKASGFNLSQGLLPDQIVFRPESDVSLETGFKGAFPAARLRLDADVFYTRRRSLQLKTSEQLDPTNPNNFVYYTENVERGYLYGLESTLNWHYSEAWTLGAALGLLQTKYQGLVQNGVVLPDRRLANAPPWQAALNLTWHGARGLFARIDVTGTGGYYFDLPPNPTTSSPYGLVNLKLGIERSRWSVSVWARNLLDRNYPVRGFYFGDEPPDFPNKLYVQLGDPRVIGASLSARLGSGR